MYKLILPLLLALMLVACQDAETSVAPEEILEATSTKTYTVSFENFPNPERGFFTQNNAWDKVFHPEWEGLPLNELRQLRSQGISLVRVYYSIPEFKGTSLSQEFLTSFAQNLSDARSAGVKLIPFFGYSWPETDDFDQHPERFENQDAPVTDVLRHLEQLKPVIQQNADVIAMWDAGFIGAWGEWHASTNNLIGRTVGSEVNSNTRQIVNKLLEVVPGNRMVTIRYPRAKQQLSGTTPLTVTQAYQGSAKARLGAKNDCFLASKNNWGTYQPSDDASIQAAKDFLHQDNLFLPQQGETCNAAADAQPFINCPNALSELAYLRFSALNIKFEKYVLQGWRDGNCFDEIARRMGYRFELVGSSTPTSVSRTQNLQMSFDIRNTGFASPYNPRRLGLVLRNQSTKKLYRIFLNSGSLTPTNTMYDPRFWQPGTTTRVTINNPLPVNLPAGTYDLLLNLPDPSPSLLTRPEYSIQLANVGTWEAATGFNSLQQSLIVR
jgi:hypothetical protein